MATNYFDRFDRRQPDRSRTPNYFDQYDASKGTPSPSGGTTPEDPRFGEGDGFFDILNRADRLGGRAINRIAGGLGRFGETVTRSIGLPEPVVDFFRHEAQTGEANAARPVEGATTWDEVKANPSFGTVAPFVIEQGLGGTPDMAAAVMAPPLYVASRAGEMGQQRAENNGRTDATIMDVLKAAPAAVGSMAMERIGFGGIVDDVAGSVIRGTLKAGAKEGGTEFGQGYIEHAGTNLGTDAGFDWRQATDQATAGLVAGAPFGAAAHGTVRAARALQGNPFDQFDPTPEADLVDAPLEGEPQLADPLTVDLGEQPVVIPEDAPPALATVPAAAPAPARRRSTGAGLPTDVVEFFRARGLPDDQARGIAAGIHAEAGGDHTAVNPTSGAFGLGQWLGPRKAELFKRYGSNPTRQQQLEFLHWELQGGDHGGKAVLGARGEGRVLDAYIRKFMRPAAGAETTGDLQRGMAALGGGEIPAPVRADDGVGVRDDEIAGPLPPDASSGDEAPSRARPYIDPQTIAAVNGGFAADPSTGRLAAMEAEDGSSVASARVDEASAPDSAAGPEIAPSRPQIPSVTREPVTGDEERVVTARGREVHDRPLAAGDLTSYRYKGPLGWVMIGAKNEAEALTEAKRSVEQPSEVTAESLEAWDGEQYAPVAPPRPEQPEQATKPSEVKPAPVERGPAFAESGSVLDRTGDDLDAESTEAAGAARKSLKDVWSDESGSANPDAYKHLVRGVFDVDGLTRDTKRIRKTIGKPTEALGRVMRTARGPVEATFWTNDAKVRAAAERFNSDALREHADLWHARAGKDDATPRTYHEAVTRESGLRSQRMFNALQPFVESPRSLSRIRDLLATPNKTVRASAAERKAAEQVRDLLKDVIDYRKAAGEDIGEVTDGYFPRELRPELVAKRSDDFIAAATEVYRRQGMDSAAAATAARNWHRHIMDSYSGLDGGVDFARSSPGTRSEKPRQFGKDADELLKDFYNQDPVDTLLSYFIGAAKRAEHARRFGNGKWEDLKKRIQDEVRQSGADPDGVMNMVEAVHASNLHLMGSRNPKFRAFISGMHAWNQLGIMDRVTITSLGELVMGFIRGGPRVGFSFFKDALQQAARHIVNAHPNDATRWAEAAGIASDAMVTHALNARAAMEISGTGTRKMMAGYYKAILLHQLTQGQREAAVKMARTLLDTWAQDMVSPTAQVRRRARLYLREAGVKEPDAFAERLRREPFTPDEVMADKGDAAVYGTALLRIANQTVMMPSAAEKPTWANHPVGSLVFSLMSYTYSFKKNVIDRGFRLGKKGVAERDPLLLYPAFALSIMAAFQGLNDTYLRPFLFGSGYDFENETPSETLLRVADRAGFTGGLSPIINAMKGVRYQRDIGTSLSGAPVGRALDTTQRIFVEPFTDRNSPNTNSTERAAATAIYDALIEPAIDGFAAARLKGPVRSAAIFGTGNKEGGVLPGDKDAFVESVAGKKPPKSEK